MYFPGHSRNDDLAPRVRDPVVRSIQRHDYRTHLGMDIAEDVSDSRLVKVHIASASRFVQAKIKTLAFEQGKYIMKEGIVIGERHHRTDRHNQQVRIEAFVLLHETRRLRRIEMPPV